MMSPSLTFRRNAEFFKWLDYFKVLPVTQRFLNNLFSLPAFLPPPCYFIPFAISTVSSYFTVSIIYLVFVLLFKNRNCQSRCEVQEPAEGSDLLFILIMEFRLFSHSLQLQGHKDFPSRVLCMEPGTAVNID